MLGVAALLAVTALLAQEFSRFTGVFAETPAAPGAMVARAEDVTSFKALRVHHQLPATDAAASRPFDVSEVVHLNRQAARPINPPVAGTRPSAHRDAPGARLAPHLAEIDPQRFSATVLAERQAAPRLPAAFFASALLDWTAAPAADPAAASTWDQRLGRAIASVDHFSAPMMIALALAETEAETDVVMAAAATPAPYDNPAAGAEESPAPVTLAMAVPLPTPRPHLAPSVEAAETAAVAPVQVALAEATVVPSPRPARSTPKSEGVLAYASPDVAAEEDKSTGIFGRLLGGGASKRLPGASAKVAVYDISSATVYMPNGQKLEAHSGLAHMQDDPGYIKEKNRGPTPPNLYNLRMRESRFHGVEAIRLLPADGRKKFNRDGLLAHTYMYVGGGSRSQSNGCVVFKDYKQFLAAFKRGEVKRLIVVPTMDKLPTYLAAL